jgi:hypothetical protein
MLRKMRKPDLVYSPAILLVMILIAGILLPSCIERPPQTPVVLTVDKDHISMGHNVILQATIKQIPDEPMILLPYVNGRRWGSHEFADGEGRATFLLPLPNPGPALIQVLAVPSDTDHWMGLTDYNLLKTSTFMPDVGKKSNTVLVEVNQRDFPMSQEDGTLFGMQWEPWFTPARKWTSAQAIPVMGIYDSSDPDVTRQHILWFMDLGVDFIIPDWSNHIWGQEHWTGRSDFANEILHTTQLFLEVLADMRDEGLPVPKVALMPGLTNGPPATMQALNEQLEWIYQDYIRNPRFKGLWQEFDGKPLIIVLDTGILAHPDGRTETSFRIPFFKQTMAWSAEEIDAFRKQQLPVDDSRFTIRWMSSQNQTTRHHEKGYWSWMDGSLKPMVTYRDGKAESVTVTPAFFAEYGWTAPEAYGRRGGWTYLESFNTALEHRPRVIMLHQFNEYTGQREGHGYGPDKNIYVDSYSVELSDDIEPVSLTTPGFRGDNGGWGYICLNMTQALIDIYRGKADDVTLLAVHVADSSSDVLKLEWTTAGIPPDSYAILLDGNTIVEETQEMEFSLSTTGLDPGLHTIGVEARGAGTRYELSPVRLDIPTEELMPVFVEKSFRVK